jgi:zinc and cadmium transporter
MSAPWVLAAYSAGIVLAAVLGGSVPLWGLTNARRLEVFLAASAGVMLGVLATHLLPEAFSAGPSAAWSIVAGFAFMLVVERFILPHALHAPQVADEHEHCDPAVESEHVRRDVAGIGAFVGLALHTLGDGLALGAAVDKPGVAPWVFLSIVAHKVPSAFALGSIMVRARATKWRVLGATAGLGTMVGVGAALFVFVRSLAGVDPHAIAPLAVGFCAGSFLHVVVTDLLPDLHRHGRERRALILVFLGGLGLMALLSVVAGD